MSKQSKSYCQDIEMFSIELFVRTKRGRGTARSVITNRVSRTARTLRCFQLNYLLEQREEEVLPELLSLTEQESLSGH